VDRGSLIAAVTAQPNSYRCTREHEYACAGITCSITG
jgi:hypothetical protein